MSLMSPRRVGGLGAVILFVGAYAYFVSQPKSPTSHLLVFLGVLAFCGFVYLTIGSKMGAILGAAAGVISIGVYLLSRRDVPFSRVVYVYLVPTLSIAAFLLACFAVFQVFKKR